MNASEIAVTIREPFFGRMVITGLTSMRQSDIQNMGIATFTSMMMDHPLGGKKE